MKSNIEERLKELKIEDFIWFVYIGIIFMSWYANSLERKFFTENDQSSKTKYREIMVGTFAVLIIVYGYFLISSYQSLKSIKKHTSDKQKCLIILSFVGALLIFVSGVIFLYIAIEDQDLNVELAFN